MRLIVSLVSLGLVVGVPSAWSSEGREHAGSWRRSVSDCMCDARAELSTVARSIREAGGIDQARRLATHPTAAAGGALVRARWLVRDGSEDLVRAHERIADYEARIHDAQTPDQVATEFESMFMTSHAAISPPVDADVDVDVGDGDGCDYSGGEIIATVLGFILGIIPGIILLILLC